MDDLFEKDDSFNDSDAIKKSNSNYLSNDKLDDFIEIEEHDIKVIILIKIKKKVKN